VLHKKEKLDSRFRGNDKEKQIRNPNFEILNKFECSKFKFTKQKQKKTWIPACAGMTKKNKNRKNMDSRLRGNDKEKKKRQKNPCNPFFNRCNPWTAVFAFTDY